MVLKEDPKTKKMLARRAWKARRAGRLGFRVSLVLIALAPLAGLGVRWLLETNGMTSGQDSLFVQFADILTIVALLLAALMVRMLTWRRCNREVGMRANQEVRIEGRYLTYTYRALADARGRLGETTMVVVDLAPHESTMTMDPQTGLITLLGKVRWRHLSRSEAVDEAVPFERLEPIAGIRVPNCFEPNLYQTLLPLYR